MTNPIDAVLQEAGRACYHDDKFVSGPRYLVRAAAIDRVLGFREMCEAAWRAHEVLSFVEQHAPGYDWNADHLGLTLRIGEVYQRIRAALPQSKEKP